MNQVDDGETIEVLLIGDKTTNNIATSLTESSADAIKDLRN